MAFEGDQWHLKSDWRHEHDDALYRQDGSKGAKVDATKLMRHGEIRGRYADNMALGSD